MALNIRNVTIWRNFKGLILQNLLLPVAGSCIGKNEVDERAEMNWKWRWLTCSQLDHIALNCCRYGDNITEISVDDEWSRVATRRQEETKENKNVKEIQVCIFGQFCHKGCKFSGYSRCILAKACRPWARYGTRAPPHHSKKLYFSEAPGSTNQENPC